MCLACEINQSADGWMRVGQSGAAERHAWLERCKEVADRVLAVRGLHLDARPGDLRVATAGGRALRIADLASLWEAAELLTGRPVDPLSPEVLALAPGPAR